MRQVHQPAVVTTLLGARIAVSQPGGQQITEHQQQRQCQGFQDAQTEQSHRGARHHCQAAFGKMHHGDQEFAAEPWQRQPGDLPF